MPHTHRSSVDTTPDTTPSDPAEFSQKVTLEVQRLAALWRKLQYVRWEPEAYRLLQRLAKNLRRALADSEHPQLHRLVSHLESVIAKEQTDEYTPPILERDQVSAAIERLTTLVGEVATDDEFSARAKTAGERGLVFVLDEDCELSELVRQHFKRQGFTVECFATVDDFRQALTKRVPVAILAEAVLADGSLAGVEIIRELSHEMIAMPPVLFISSRGDMEARIAAIRAGGQAFFTKPLDLDMLVRRIDKQVQTAPGKAGQVFIVEDDPDQAEYYSLVLQQAGIRTSIITNPTQLLEKMQASPPDLVLMDVHLPGCDGQELATMIRQDPRYEDLPVVFMSAITDTESELALMRESGDLFLKKPVDQAHLMAVVQGRIRRAREVAHRMQLISKHDQTTGLYNRQYFLRSLRSVMGRIPLVHIPSSLMYLELDDFRLLQDQLGLAAAELVMADLAGVVSKQLAPGDIAARYGDSSLMIILHGRQLDDLDGFCHQLAERVSKNVFQAGGNSLMISASMGVTRLDRPSFTQDEWVNHVAALCMKARSEGKGQVLLEQPGRSHEQGEDLDKECLQLLKQALRDEGFYLVFQPIASLNGSHVERYEVLLRLRSTEGEELLPARFLPVAHARGLMPYIDQWVIIHSLQVLTQRSASKDSVLFVKVSGESLHSEKFFPWLEQQLKLYKVPAGKIVLELDEASVVASMNEASAFINKVKRLGCEVGLEHFGTHLNASQILKHLHMDYVKIDGSFIHALVNNPANQSTLRDMVASAADQDAMIIAGFVEDAASLNILWRTGVQYIQGNFLQEPDGMLAFDFNELGA